MKVLLVNKFVSISGEKETGVNEFDSLPEAIKEFNRVVDMTETLISCKNPAYQPYDEILLVSKTDKTTLKQWRKEDFINDNTQCS